MCVNNEQPRGSYGVMDLIPGGSCFCPRPDREIRSPLRSHRNTSHEQRSQK